MVQIAGVTFHLYGFLVGAGLVVVFSLMEKKIRTTTFAATKVTPALIVVVLGALLGARLYHVITDWQLYQHNWGAVWQIWQGGLSIIGAIMGGLMGLGGWAYWRHWTKHELWTFLDALVFGLPFGQALGRLGNFVNQELYGAPSTLPWAIYIDPTHRVAGYETVSHFHPLFAYEAIPLLLLGLALWQWGRRPLGSGWYVWIYLVFYTLLRFSLDFLRLDKTMLGSTGLGVNQLVMLIALGVSSFTLVKRYYTPGHFRVTMK